MAHRIEVAPKIPDARAKVREERLRNLGFPVSDLSLVGVYTLEDNFDAGTLIRIADMLSNPVSQGYSFSWRAPENFDFAIETGFLPGVTDNVGNTAGEAIEDLIKTRFRKNVYSSEITFLSGVSKEQAVMISERLANPLIQRIHLKTREQFEREQGMGTVIPKVRLTANPKVDLVDILNADEIELQRIGKLGIYDHDEEISARDYADRVLSSVKDQLRRGDLVEKDGKFFQKVRRGPLALDSVYMKTIQSYFQSKGRNPKDIELESLAQTWSEHCKHTIFADPIDEIKDGLFKHFIKRATEEVRRAKGIKDFCVSVFSDNSGIIVFDEKYNVCFKVETHNSPSALDPYGGSITGIVGVNRDPMGTGLGSKPFINLSGPFCFAPPDDILPIYKGANKSQRMLLPRQTHDGVVDGVRVGGNCSGIPTSHFRMVYNYRYKGKPLVHVGTGGVMPKISAGRLSHEKAALEGDLIVMTGGRVGKDGIHGATFSSEAMDSGSPATAVQIGDPITQKKMSDALIKEARDKKLYTSITDNGAGGLSCSVAEMAKESGGCKVYLDKVPLKYPGLNPWEIWISESQERMTLSVPKNKIKAFQELMRKRGVESTVIGEFTNSGKCEVEFNGEKVMDVEMSFLHDGLPSRAITSSYTPQVHEEPVLAPRKRYTKDLEKMLARFNVASIEYVNRQFDHEVQGGSTLKPLQGRGQVNANATITRPVLSSMKGVVVSQGINPAYSDIDPYHMAACAIDSAVRGAISVGARLDKIALLDNFCWCSSNEPERLGQLKRACQAAYDIAVKYRLPFISGKDSMFNDFKGFDEQGRGIKISIPPTLLITVVAVMDDVRKAVSMDAKSPGDFVYVVGETNEELGASEYYAMRGEEVGKKFIGNNVPAVSAARNIQKYEAIPEAINRGLISSCQSVDLGGLAIALAKTSIAGLRGMDLSIENIPGSAKMNHSALFSESQGRFVLTVSPENDSAFNRIMKDYGVGELEYLGDVTLERFRIRGRDGKITVNISVEDMHEAYKSTFKEY